MKRLILPLLFGLPIILFSQNIRYEEYLTIKFDALEGAGFEKPPFGVRSNGGIRFDITNINLFLYNVSVTEIQRNIVNDIRLNEVQSSFAVDPLKYNVADLHIGSMPSLNFSYDDNDLQTRLVQIESAKEQLNKLKERRAGLANERRALYRDLREKAEFESQKRRYEIELARLGNMEGNEQEEERNRLTEGLNEVNAWLQALEGSTRPGRLDSVDIRIKTVDAQMLSAAGDIDQLENRISGENQQLLQYNEFEFALEAYRHQLNQLNAVADYYQKLVCLMYSSGKEWEEIRKEKRNMTARFIDVELRSSAQGELPQFLVLEECQNRLAAIQSSFSNLEKAFRQIPEKDNLDFETIEDYFRDVSAYHNQISDVAFKAFFEEVGKVYATIIAEHYNLTSQTFVIRDNADAVRYIVRGEPVVNAPCSLPVKAFSFEFVVHVKGGIKIDASTGLFFNVGLTDPAYRFEALSDSSSRVVQEQDNSPYLPSLGILLHMYRRSAAQLKPGLCIGASTNGNRLRYYLGGSLLFGRSQRFIVNAGVAGGQVAEVADQYRITDSENGYSSVINAPRSDLPASVPLRDPEPWRFGAFLGLSFNITGDRNREALSGFGL